MLKKIGLSAMLFAALMILAAPPQAGAAVRFGVSIGAPVYTYPSSPYPYPYVGPTYAYPNAPYAYATPGYVAPYYSFGWGGHERRDLREHERLEHHDHEFRGNTGFRDRDRHR